jgi:hypothetical protein
VILATPLDQAWAALSHLKSARGTIAGHTGTARLEVADDDTHTAVFRLHGSGRTVTATATLTRSEAGTRLDVTPELPHAFTATLAAALSAPGPLSRLVRA